MAEQIDLPHRMRGAMLLGPEQIETREVALDPPAPGEFVLRVEAATTCGTDVKVFRRGGHPRMLTVPTLFGHEMAGRVAARGEGVHEFEVGDPVVVANSAPCGECRRCRMGRENLCEDLQYLNGAFAQFIVVPPRFVRANTHRIPSGIDFSRAALTEPLACVLHGIDACGLGERNPQEIAVYGGGPIGLMFVAALARDGHRVMLADPNPSRLEVGLALGARQAVCIERGGGQAAAVIERAEDACGVSVAIDCTGVPEVWSDAMASVAPGGLVLLFGGCAPGTTVALDTHWVHYSEITIKGVYHHRPATIARALALLADPEFPMDALLSDECSVDRVEWALRQMMSKQALKVVVRP